MVRKINVGLGFAALAAALLLQAPLHAQDSMQQDSMKQDEMKKDSMKQGQMQDDKMKHDSFEFLLCVDFPGESLSSPHRLQPDRSAAACPPEKP
jgi:pentapeptide MXKDX repeat protein